MTRILKTAIEFEREPLLRPFGFKGGYLSELWQAVSLLEAEGGADGIGVGTQSVLWSDANVFSSCSESAGNAYMFAISCHALQLARGLSFDTPLDLLEQILPQAWEYGRAVTGRSDLRQTFVLNALVGMDAAAWLLYARENGFSTFDEMLPERFRPILSERHAKLASIPLMTYGVPLEEISRSVDDGYFFLKIKIGSDPEGDGDREKMLQWDMRRVEAIHNAIGSRPVKYTDNGKVPYYLDANGRYDSRERLERLLEHCDRIGMLEQIAIIEEPFAEDFKCDVSGLGVRIAADESAHCDTDVAERIALGYSAIALKPMAKTLSMTLRIAEVAHRHGIPMFCADLTCSPLQVDWNKNFAARLAPLPGLKVGLIETNGHQNYRNWEELNGYHPIPNAPWSKVEDGCFSLDDEFYRTGGGIFGHSEHYSKLLKHQ